MRNTKCRGRVRGTTPEFAMYMRQVAGTNSKEMSRLKRNLLHAMREELTERQRQILTLYYDQDMTIYRIGEKLSIHPTTVSRTLRRAEDKFRRCLRYGASAYLRDMTDN